ncbi:MAG: 1-acyl-sn-glycerol-3-phosphate acyltransferase [Planctomycetes bacterium]|nr:1-acyl-sn-glycerol-3-phosphate acyltransferase [Planctomycetota bacterium]
MFDPADLADVRRMLDHTEGLVRRGVPVLFFPEGARQTGAELGRFEGGAFEVAMRCGADVLPVVVRRTGDLVPRGSLVFHDVEVTVTPLERVPAGTDRAALVKRVRDAMRAVFEAA